MTTASDPKAILDQLGARWSPDLDAYASGALDLSQVRCVLCGHAPCTCRPCQAPYRSYLATEAQPCGMTIQPNGECPRGHRADPPGPVPLTGQAAPCPECSEPLSVHSADLGCWLCDCTYGRGPAS